MKLLTAIAIISLTAGCSKSSQNPMDYGVLPVSNTENCKMVNVKTIQTASWNQTKYTAHWTKKLGGDSYKIISITPITIAVPNDGLSTTFGVYSCNGKK